MMANYNDVKIKHEEMAEMVPLLKSLEVELEKAKKDKKAPLYAFKSRIKEKDSIYLKMKRKGISLDQIEDYGGLRVLCLFEQDLLPTFRYLLNLLKKSDFELKKMETYNWNVIDGCTYNNLTDEVHTIFSHEVPTHPSKKGSGYKSIHLNVIKGIYPIEIQVRTLLQDVWGELEHALSYKQGNIHPHIKKSFSLLASHLQTADDLTAHLRDIADKDKCTSNFAMETVGPQAPLAYEQSLLPKSLETKWQDVNNYYKIIESGISEDNEGKILEAQTLLDSIICNPCTQGASADDQQLRYWERMEGAYIQFCQHNYDAAKEIYHDVLKNEGKDRYAPDFRLGEIYFILGNLIESLKHFDACEEKLESTQNNDSNPPTQKNLCLVKERIANVLWLMGEPYYDRAAKKITEASDIFEKIKKKKEYSSLKPFVREFEPSLRNYLCYYHLESYILAKRDFETTDKGQKNYNKKRSNYKQKYSDAKNKFNKLKKYLESGCSAGMYDTAAWFSYHAYLKENKESYLADAKKYLKLGWTKKSEGIHDKGSVQMHAIESSNIRRLHTQEIIHH